MPGKIRWKRKSKRYTPIQESFPSSTSELPLAPPALPSHSQLAIPHREWCHPHIPRECIVCIPPPSFCWLQHLSPSSQIIAASALLSDLASHFRMCEYNAIIQSINGVNICSLDRETSVYLLFAVGCAYYELKQYKHARNCLSECKLVASGVGDISLCYFYLGKVASALHSHRKAAKHYREAALCCHESSVAKTFNLTQPSRSALHRQSSIEFCKVGCYPQALDELTQATETAHAKEEYFLAHCDRGKLYRVMANYAMALDDFELAGELAEELGNCVAAKQAYKDACDACIVLHHEQEALQFFECSLSCVSLDCRRCFPGSEQRIRDLQWICDIVDRLPRHTAIKRLPPTYINGLRDMRERMSSEFQVELERYHVECQEEEDATPNVYPIVVEEHFPATEPPEPQLVTSFLELVERQPEDLVQVEFPITELLRYRSNRTLLLEEIQPFPWLDPDLRNNRSLIEVQSDTGLY